MNPADKELRQEYKSYLLRKWLVLLILLMILLAIMLVSAAIGSSGIDLGQVLAALFRKGSASAQTILWDIRLPRIVTAVVVGAALAVSGCLMQCVLRNPLASASTLGVTQGASFGAAFAIVCLGAGAQANVATADAVTISNPFLVTSFAFLGGILTTVVILGLSRIVKVSPSAMVLAGVALSSMFSGGTTIIQYFADDVQVAAVVYWTFGDLGRSSWQEIGIMFGLCLLAMVYFLYHRWDYNAMDHGVQTAKSLGIPVDRLMLLTMVVCSLLVSVCVAFVGCISFIGLIAPHMVRKFVGNDHRFLIPASALAGAIVLTLAELVSRTVVSPAILPVGAITSFLGAPLFLAMIFKRRRSGYID